MVIVECTPNPMPEKGASELSFVVCDGLGFRGLGVLGSRV